MRKKISLEDEINKFLEIWNCETQQQFLKAIIPMIDLYNVEEDDDWLKDAVGVEDERNVRLIRTVYIISRIADFYTGKLIYMKTNFKNLWKRMEIEGCIDLND